MSGVIKAQLNVTEADGCLKKSKYYLFYECLYTDRAKAFTFFKFFHKISKNAVNQYFKKYKTKMEMIW